MQSKNHALKNIDALDSAVENNYPLSFDKSLPLKITFYLQ